MSLRRSSRLSSISIPPEYDERNEDNDIESEELPAELELDKLNEDEDEEQEENIHDPKRKPKSKKKTQKQEQEKQPKASAPTPAPVSVPSVSSRKSTKANSVRKRNKAQTEAEAEAEASQEDQEAQRDPDGQAGESKQLNSKSKSQSRYFKVLASSSSLKTIADQWVTLYQTEESTNNAQLTFIKLMGEVAGISFDVQVDDLMESDRRSFIHHHAAIDNHLTNFINSSSNQTKILNRYSEFIKRCMNSLNLDESGFEFIIEWIIAMSSANIRNLRIIHTQAAQAAMNSLIENLKSLDEKADIASQQLKQAHSAASSKNRKSNGVINQLSDDLELNQNHINIVESSIKSLFNGVYIHRYRDVEPLIRTNCMNSIGSWLLSCPRIFVSDHYLKYIGWTFCDSESEVRLAAALAIKNFYEKSSNEIQAKMAVFTTRFLPRFEEMTNDVDDKVSSVAIQILTILLKASVLGAEFAGRIPCLLWDANESIRKSAADFVFEDVFADSASENQSSRVRESDIEEFLKIFEKFCPAAGIFFEKNKSLIQAGALSDDQTQASQARKKKGKKGLMVPLSTLNAGFNLASSTLNDDLAHSMEVMVQLFWDKLSALHDFQLLIKLTMNESSLESQTQSEKNSSLQRNKLICMAHLLLACCKLHYSKEKEKAKKSSSVNGAGSLSSVLISQLPQILSFHQADGQLLIYLLPLIEFVDPNQYSTLRAKADLENLIKIAKSLFIKQNSVRILERIVRLFYVLVGPDTQIELNESNNANTNVNTVNNENEMDLEEESLGKISVNPGRRRSRREISKNSSSSKSHVYVDEIKDSVTSLFSEILNNFHEAELISDPSERLLSLLNASKRILTFIRMFPTRSLWSTFPSLSSIYKEVIVEDDAKHDDKKVQLIANLLHIQYQDLIWLLFHAQPSESKLLDNDVVTELVNGQETIVSDLVYVFENFDSPSLADEAFRISVDLLILFSKRNIAQIAFSDKLFTQLSQEINKVYTQLIQTGQGNNNQNEESDDSLNNRRRFLTICASRLIQFDLNNDSSNMNITLRHSQLAAMVISQYKITQNDEENDFVIKHLMTGLRSLSPNILMIAQFDALEYVYSLHEEEPRLSDLAKHLSAIHSFNANNRSFQAFFNKSIPFALSHIPSNLSFLKYIIPFLQKSNVKDVALAQKLFEKHAASAETFLKNQPDQTDDQDWIHYKAFITALGKKQKNVKKTNPNSNNRSNMDQMEREEANQTEPGKI